MTTFDILESSLESSRPVELYEVTKGHRRMAVDVGGGHRHDRQRRLRVRVHRAQQDRAGRRQQNRTVTVTVPRANEFASQYVDVPPGEKATVNIGGFAFVPSDDIFGNGLTIRKEEEA